MLLFEKVQQLEYTPVNRYVKAGSETQICDTFYKNVRISEWTHFPYSIFKHPTSYHVIDLQLPMKTKVEGGEMSDCYYTKAGYGLPVITHIEDVIKFLDAYFETIN